MKETLAKADVTRHRIREIWQQVLELDEIDPGVSFFELGGDSITVTLVISRIRQRLGIPVQIRTIFEHSTLDEFSNAVQHLLAVDKAQSGAVPACAAESQYEDNSKRPATGKGSGNNPASEADVSFSLFFFSGNAEETNQNRYRLVMEGAKYADQNGFEAIWTPERHFNVFGGLYPNPAVLGAALAAATKRIGIRGGSVQAPMHHPLRIAEEWAVVDNISNGRAGLAFATGFLSTDFVLAPDNFSQRRQIMYDTLETVRKVWRGEPYYGIDGTGREISVSFYPTPVQSELPVWLAATRLPETFIKAGEIGANILTALIALSVEDLAERIRLYRETLAQYGHDPKTRRVTIMLHTFVGEDEETVLGTVRKPFMGYLRSHMGAMKPLAAQHGIDWDSAQFTPEDQEALLSFAFERYYANSLIGTEKKCIEMVERLAKIGVNEMACLVDFGVAQDEMLDSLAALNRVRKQVTKQRGSA